MTQLNLMAHCGAHHTDRAAVLAAPTPEGTATHKPIPHGVLLGTVESQLESVGLTTVQEQHAIAHGGARYFGMLEVTNGARSPDYSIVLGLRNAHDKAFAAGLVVGSGVFVCDNLCFSGEIKVGRKHTRFILDDLADIVAGALLRVAAMRDSQDQRIVSYRGTELSDAVVHDLLVRSLMAGVIPSAKIGQVLQEWHEPRHAEFRQDGPTAWRLMNAYTEIMKPRREGDDLFTLPARTAALHEILDTTCREIS